MKLVDLANKFLDANIAPKEIVQNTFAIQIQLSKIVSKKTTNLEEFAAHLISIIIKLIEIDSPHAFSIINVIPSIIHKIDTQDQKYLQQMVLIDASFDSLLPMYHALSELPLTNNCSKVFFDKLSFFIETDPKYSLPIMNVAIFLFEYRKDQKWANLIRIALMKAPDADLPSCALLIKSRRSSTRELSDSICTAIRNSDTIFKSDFFLILVLHPFAPDKSINTLLFLMKQKRIQECSLKEYPLKVINVNDLIDCFCGLCSIRISKENIDMIAHFLFEAFISSSNVKFFTFALDNEDENANLLDATIKAFELCVSETPSFLISLPQFDIISILYTVSSRTMEKLIYPILKLSSTFIHLFDDIVVYLKKISNQPGKEVFVIQCFSYLLEHCSDNSIQIQIIDTLQNIGRTPLLRSKVFDILSQVEFDKKIQIHILNSFGFGEISRNILQFDYTKSVYENSCFKFKDLVHSEKNSFTCDFFPASTLKLFISFKFDMIDYIWDSWINGIKNRSIDLTNHYPIELCVWTDFLAVISPMVDCAFMYFCEFFRIIDQGEFPEFITQWCDLKLDYSFARNCIVENKYQDPLYLFVLLRNLRIHAKPIDDELLNAYFSMFKNMYDLTNPSHEIVFPKKYKHLMTKYYDRNPDLFSSVYIDFREELTTILSNSMIKNLPEDELDVSFFIKAMEEEIDVYYLTQQHCDAYLKILSDVLKKNKDSSEQLFKLLQTIVTDNKHLIYHVILLTLKKSPEDDAYIIAQTIINSFGDNEILNITSNLQNTAIRAICSWLCGLFKENRSFSQDAYELVKVIISLDVEKCGIYVYTAIYRLISLSSEFDRIHEFRSLVNEWLNKHSKEIGKKKVSQMGALLHMMSIGKDLQKGHEALKPRQKYFNRKWRSKNKFIDEGLREISDSEDNFADLEEFIVDESSDLNPENEDSTD